MRGYKLESSCSWCFSQQQTPTNQTSPDSPYVWYPLGSDTPRRGELEPVALGTTHSISCPSGQQPGKLRARSAFRHLFGFWLRYTASASLLRTLYCAAVLDYVFALHATLCQHGHPFFEPPQFSGAPNSAGLGAEWGRRERRKPLTTIHCILWISERGPSVEEQSSATVSICPFFFLLFAFSVRIPCWNSLANCVQQSLKRL